MEFSGQYLTYEEYRALGGTLDLTPFNLLEFEARKQIDLRTLGRLKNIEDIPEEVKLCDYKLIESIDNYAQSMETADKNIASESTDGYSVSYITNNQVQDIVKSKNTEFDDLIMTELFGVVINGEHIIYNGVL